MIKSKHLLSGLVEKHSYLNYVKENNSPVAYDIESVLAEIGLASAQVCDYRNFCHVRKEHPMGGLRW